MQISSLELVSLAASSRIEPVTLQTVRRAAENDPEYQKLQQAISRNPKSADQHLSLDDGLLWYKGRLYIPEKQDVKLYILEQDHDSKVARHWGHVKTLEILSRN